MGGTDKNYYELLGLKRDASAEEIKRAYRDMSRIFHPDSNFYSDLVDDPVSEEHIAMFKLITDAYNILISNEERVRYDQTLLNGTLVGWADDENPYYSAPQTQAKQFRQNVSVAPNAASRNTKGFGSVAPQTAPQGSTLEKEPHSIAETLNTGGVFSRLFWRRRR